MKITKRLGLAVWMKDLRKARSLERLGNIHFISKRLKYVYMYVDQHSADQLIRQIERQPFVKRVDPSKRNQITLDFSQALKTL